MPFIVSMGDVSGWAHSAVAWLWGKCVIQSLSKHKWMSILRVKSLFNISANTVAIELHLQSLNSLQKANTFFVMLQKPNLTENRNDI
jgi:hypothetical protein